jgi:hypothetical protein
LIGEAGGRGLIDLEGVNPLHLAVLDHRDEGDRARLVAAKLRGHDRLIGDGVAKRGGNLLAAEQIADGGGGEARGDSEGQLVGAEQNEAIELADMLFLGLVQDPAEDRTVGVA